VSVIVPKGGLFCADCNSVVRVNKNGVPTHDSKAAEGGNHVKNATRKHELREVQTANDDVVSTRATGWSA